MLQILMVLNHKNKLYFIHENNYFFLSLLILGLNMTWSVVRFIHTSATASNNNHHQLTHVVDNN